MILIVVTSNCVFAHNFPALSFRLGFFAFSALALPPVPPLPIDRSDVALGLCAAVCEDGASVPGEDVDGEGDLEVEGIVIGGTAQVNGFALGRSMSTGACLCRLSMKKKGNIAHRQNNNVKIANATGSPRDYVGKGQSGRVDAFFPRHSSNNPSYHFTFRLLTA